MAIKKTRKVYVMSADDMQVTFMHDIDVVFSRSVLAGRVNTDTAPTPAEAVVAVVGGVWHVVPTRTLTRTYIDVDDNIASQIHRIARAHGGCAAISYPSADACCGIMVPHGYTVMQREIDGTIQYALVATDGHVHVV